MVRASLVALLLAGCGTSKPIRAPAVVAPTADSAPSCRNGDAAACTRLRVASQQACDSGDASACDDLGSMWKVGQGGPRDPARARVLYDKACSGGRAGGCRELAALWAAGVGGQEDVAKARDLYAKACKGDDDLARIQ